MSLWQNGREPIQVPAECVEHFGEPPGHHQLVSDYAAIGSPADWARRCGEAVGDDQKTWEAIAMLLELGTGKSETTSLALKGFRRLCPTATGGTYWAGGVEVASHIGSTSFGRHALNGSD